MSHRVYPAAYESDLANIHDQDFGGFFRGPSSFWLPVPASALVTARPLCRRHGIAADLGYWWNDGLSAGFGWLKVAA